MYCGNVSSLPASLILIFAQEGKYKEAARAIALFSYFSPHDITVKKSMSFYKSMIQKQLSEEDLVSTETLAYVSLPT